MAYVKSNILNILTNSTISITDLTRTGAKTIFASLVNDSEKIILKNNKPIGALLSVDRYQELLEIEEDYLLYKESMKRLEMNKSNVSMKTILEENNITQEEIDSVGEIEIQWFGKLNLLKKLEKIFLN